MNKLDSLDYMQINIVGKLSVSDLIYLDKAFKALKQKVVLVYDYKLYGVDFIDKYMVYLSLNPNKLSNDFIKLSTIPMIINTSNLSKFVKTITNECDFNIYDAKFNILTTIAGGELRIDIDNGRITHYTNNHIINNIINSSAANEEEIDIKYVADLLYKTKSGDGAQSITINGYKMYVFPLIIPVAKNSGLFCTIYDTGLDNSFLTKFRLVKEGFDIFIYIRYLKL